MQTAANLKDLVAISDAIRCGRCKHELGDNRSGINPECDQFALAEKLNDEQGN